MEITYHLQPSTENTAIMAEFLRFKAYGINASKKDLDDYFIDEITSGRLLVFTCNIDNEPVAVAYISNFSDSLFVDYLFVIPEYRNKGLQLGRNLLLYIINNKQIVEEYFNRKFKYSKLSATSEKTKSLYLKIGYKESTNNTDLLIRSI